MHSLFRRKDFLFSLTLLSIVGEVAYARVSSPKFFLVSGQQPNSKPADQVYEPGGDVKAPKLVHYVEPEFSPSSKEAYVEGSVKISTVVTAEGDPSDCHVVRGLSTEEDRTAVEALKQWKFQPGTKSGRPVKVHVTVEIDFHLL